MWRRWLGSMLWVYPAIVLSVSSIFGAWPALQLIWQGSEIGRVEVLPIGIVVQSAAWQQMLTQSPGKAAVFAVLVLALVQAAAVRLSRISAIASAVLSLGPTLILTPYFVFQWEEHRWLAAGVCSAAAAAVVTSQWRLLTAGGAPRWLAWFGAWVPLSLACVGLVYAGARGPGLRMLWPASGLFVVGASVALCLPRREQSEEIPAKASLWWLALGVTMGWAALAWGATRMPAFYHAQSLRKLEAIPAVVKQWPPGKLRFQKGMSLVADREAFGSEVTARVIREAAGYGVDALGIVVHGAGPRPEGSRESNAEIEVLVRRAHAMGMNVMLKPHHRVRRNEVATSEGKRAWFERQREGIREFGKLAERLRVELFCVAYEMGPLYREEAEWRKVIATARQVYRGPLVACPMQGEEFEGIRFWDALDYIGIDNYYPIPDSYDYAGVFRKIEAIHKKYAKPVIFTEAGFASVEGAHRGPWAEPRRAYSAEEQRRCYRLLFAWFYGREWFQGVYWWKLDTDGPGGPGDRSLTPWGKPAMEELRKWYQGPERSVSKSP